MLSRIAYLDLLYRNEVANEIYCLLARVFPYTGSWETRVHLVVVEGILVEQYDEAHLIDQKVH